MMKSSKQSLLLIAACLAAACTTLPTGPKASTTLSAKSGSSVVGEITFSQLYQGVQIKGNISGLKPNQEHGFHVHDKGDCSSADGLSAAGHFNPESKAHGHHTSATHHAGDMPNLKANAEGKAAFDFILDEVSLVEGKNAIVGRAVIVHANPDDYTSQPVGNAGGRIACGLISTSK